MIMRNILTIDTKKTPYEFNYCNEGNCQNEIKLDIYVSNLVNPFLEIIKQDATIETTSTLEIIDNQINYIIPYDTYKSKGTLLIAIKAENYESEYIEFTITNDLSSTDDVIVKLEDSIFVIKKISVTKSYELPTATTNSLGGIIVGDNLTIDEQGVLSLGNIFNLIYPVGSIYTSVNSTSPATLFGGTWERIQGYFLLAANDKYEQYQPGKTGGSVTHTHTINGHTHGYGSLYAAMANAGTSGHYYKSKAGISFTPNEYKKDTGAGYTTTTKQTEGIQVYGTTGGSGTLTTNSADGMPPYLAVYVWKRTA